ncbi:hypothetical protein STEG23_027368, partial [Scotinomys teguina]
YCAWIVHLFHGEYLKPTDENYVSQKDTFYDIVGKEQQCLGSPKHSAGVVQALLCRCNEMKAKYGEEVHKRNGRPGLCQRNSVVLCGGSSVVLCGVELQCDCLDDKLKSSGLWEHSRSHQRI